MNILDLLVQVAHAARLSDGAQAYASRHGLRSAPTLTVADDEIAGLVAASLEPRIRDKIVVDVGGGIGLLGLHLAVSARHVFVIEADPIWSLGYLEFFHRKKPRNLSFMFGAAEEFVGQIKADIAVVATHSDVAGMMCLANQFAGTSIDIYGELIAANPNAFDPWAREARGKA